VLITAFGTIRGSNTRQIKGKASCYLEMSGSRSAKRYEIIMFNCGPAAGEPGECEFPGESHAGARGCLPRNGPGAAEAGGQRSSSTTPGERER